MKRVARVRDLAWYRENVPCLVACPVRTDCGRYVQLIGEGRYEAAYLVARAPNPLASVCGRVCAAPCEDACRRGHIDRPVAIRALKRFVCERYGLESAKAATEHQLTDGWTGEGSRTVWHLPTLGQGPASGAVAGTKVAVVGAGPAGLACAHDLARLGYEVTVFEAAEAPGGMLRYGVPEYRLPREVIDASVTRLKDLGVVFRFRTPLSPTFGLAELRALGFAAIFLGVGAWAGRDLLVPGHDLDGVVKAVDYLLNINRGYRVDLGERVVVIGGGSVALDAARTALREMPAGASQPSSASETGPETATQPADLTTEGLTTAVDAARAALRAGAREVHVVSLESESEMPAARTEQGREELEQARLEGIQFHFSRGPKALRGTDGRVTGVVLHHCRRVFDASGRFAPEFEPDSDEELQADSVVLAIGQAVALDFLQPSDGIQLTRHGTIAVDAETMATSAPDVFAGGDAAFGPRIIIDAEAHGKLAALSIHGRLSGGARPTTLQVTIDEIPTREYRMPDRYDEHERVPPPSISSDRRVGVTEVEQVYDEADAASQAMRCLSCHVHPIYNASLCVLCGRCADVCPYSCLEFVPLAQVDLDAASHQAVSAQLGSDGPGGDAVALIKDEERCIRCGLCAIRCPTGAFTMERFSFDEVLG